MSNISKPTANQPGSGTQSPPLEATGEDKPMGMSSVHGNTNSGPLAAVPDSEQRKEYFHGSDKEQKERTSGGTAKAQKMGQSLADKYEKIN